MEPFEYHKVSHEKKTKEIYDDLVSTLVTVLCTTLKKWYHAFKLVRESCDNGPRLGRLGIMITDENVTRIPQNGCGWHETDHKQNSVRCMGAIWNSTINFGRCFWTQENCWSDEFRKC